MRSSNYSNGEELKSKVISSLKAFGFYVFTKEEYPHVSRLLRKLSLWNLFKIRPLGSSRSYFILEPDVAAYFTECRNVCIKEGVVDVKCYLKCKERKVSELMSEIFKKLEGGTVEGT